MSADLPSAKKKHPGGKARPATREEVARLHVRGVANLAIAKRLGLAAETVSRWLREPAVQKRVHELAQDAMHEARAELERAALRSAKTLVKIMDGRAGRNAKERRLAAEAILDRIGLVKGEKRETEITVQGNPGAVAIALAIEAKKKREASA